jgi:hypothetical protein
MTVISIFLVVGDIPLRGRSAVSMIFGVGMELIGLGFMVVAGKIKPGIMESKVSPQQQIYLGEEIEV